MGAIIGIIHLVLVVLAITRIMKSDDPGVNKVIWIIASFVFIIAGPAAYLYLKSKK